MSFLSHPGLYGLSAGAHLHEHGALGVPAPEGVPCHGHSTELKRTHAYHECVCCLCTLCVYLVYVWLRLSCLSPNVAVCLQDPYKQLQQRMRLRQDPGRTAQMVLVSGLLACWENLGAAVHMHLLLARVSRKRHRVGAYQQAATLPASDQRLQRIVHMVVTNHHPTCSGICICVH